MSESNKSFKYCIVPKCKSTTFTTPNKIFFSVPRHEKVRKKWCHTMKRNNQVPLSSSSCLYCCEDHFNVKEDTVNYIEYNIMKQNGEKRILRLKKGVVPHKFMCQNLNMPPPKRRATVKRLALVNEALSEFASKSNILESEEPPQRIDCETSSCTSHANVHDNINQAGPSTSHIEVCDDHLKNDITNDTEYNIKGSVKRIRMKANCTPSKFDCKPDRKRKYPSEPRHAFNKRQRMIINQEIEESVGNESHVESLPSCSEGRGKNCQPAPLVVKVCRICLAMDCKLLSMAKYKLEATYSHLTGQSPCQEDGLPQMLCSECTKRLLNFKELRRKSMRANTLLLDIVRRRKRVTIENIKNINRQNEQLISNLLTKHQLPDHYDLNIEYDENHKQLDNKEYIIVKIEAGIDVQDEVIEGSIDNQEDVTVEDKNDDHFNDDCNNDFNIVDDLNDDDLSNDEDTSSAYSEEEEINVKDKNDENHDDCDDDSNEEGEVYNEEKEMKVEVKNEENDDSNIDDDVQDDSANDEEGEEECDVGDIQSSIVQPQILNIVTVEQGIDIQEEMIDIKYENNSEILNGNVKLEDPIGGIDNNIDQNPSNSMSLMERTIQEIKEARKRKMTSHTKGLNLNKNPLLNNDQNLALFTTADITFDEQIQEIQRRKESSTYKTSLFKCTECYKGFGDEDAYKTHMVRHTDQCGKWHCEVCKIYCKSRNALRAHKAIHSQRYSCKECDFVTLHRQTAIHHERWHKGTTYKCPHCPEVFTKLTTLMGHIRVKHPSDVVCQMCGYSFMSEKGKQMHIRSKHVLDKVEISENSPFCEPCNLRFVSTEAYQCHMNVSPKHGGTKINKPAYKPTNKPVKKPIHDGKKQQVKRTRENNEEDQPDAKEPPLCKQMKRIEGPIPCEQCDKEVPNFKAYVDHFRRMHPDKNRTKYPALNQFMCEVCGKIFPSYATLKDHNRNHTGDKPFKCKLCPKTFSSSSCLQGHQRIHSEAKATYNCDICAKQFSTHGNKQRHMFKHTGVKKPFKCDVCKKCFQFDSEKKNHIAYVHQKKPWPKRVRPKRPTK